MSRPTFVSPAEGRVSSEWGSRRHPISGKAGWHRGIDIANSTGTPIYAAYGGKVRQANTGTGTNPITGAWNTGRSIIIDGPGGGSEFYGHLQSINVRVGQTVRAGDRIATMGATGNVTGPHLHFECWSGRNQGGGAGAGNTRNPRTDFNKHGVTPGSKPALTTAPAQKKTSAPKKESKPVTTPAQFWSHRGLDYTNKNASTKNHQLARSHQYSLNIWNRIRQAAWRTWLAQGIWGRRIKPESSVARTYPGIRDDGYLASTWVQYAYSQARQAKEQAEKNAAAIEALAKSMEQVAKGDGQHVYEAVAAAMAEHDQRQVEVNVQIAEAEADDSEEATADDDTPEVMAEDADPDETEQES